MAGRYKLRKVVVTACLTPAAAAAAADVNWIRIRVVLFKAPVIRSIVKMRDTN